ncbi:MAG TPA: short-chain dehydrogenase [Maritimibacter sp.]|nr:short-chain dehydrogenase [Maritimibacter sp.]
MKVAIIGISGKLGQYMTQHALNLGYDVVGVCRPESVEKLARFGDRITIIPGRTNNPDVVRQAVQDADGVLTVLAPWGVDDYASGTVRAVLEHAPRDARLIFSSGWHLSVDGKDRYGWKIHFLEKVVGPVVRALRLVDIQDQHRAGKLIFSSGRRWTLVRGSDLEEGESEGLPIWAERAHDPRLAANRTCRTDFALFMVKALTDERLVQVAPAISAAA